MVFVKVIGDFELYYPSNLFVQNVSFLLNQRLEDFKDYFEWNIIESKPILLGTV